MVFNMKTAATATAAAIFRGRFKHKTNTGEEKNVLFSDKDLT